MPSLKQVLGCWIHERWKTEIALSPWSSRLCGLSWVDLCNRNEELLQGDNGAKVCQWEGSSFLTVARLNPKVGGRLLRSCLRQWPLALPQAAGAIAQAAPPQISVILPVGGEERKQSFTRVLSSLLFQSYPHIEIVVVEHGVDRCYEDACPPTVKYVFVRKDEDEEFNKSLALNMGARTASAAYLLLHDADIVVPRAYVERVVSHLDSGWEAIRPIRFSFNLEKEDSMEFICSNGKSLPKRVHWIQQNNPGLSTAIFKKVYEEIGGHDERFEGWGGEDLEFLDRLRTRRLFRGGYLPVIHLWHTTAPKKRSGERNNDLLLERLRLPVQTRIEQLRAEYFYH
jgi:hypothetical protein